MPLFKDTAGGTLAERIRKAGEQQHPTTAPQDNKRLPREPVYAIGTLITASAKIPVVVRNVNRLGARVEFTANVPLRGDITLVASVLGLNTRVRVAWQRSGSAGLIFVKQGN